MTAALLNPADLPLECERDSGLISHDEPTRSAAASTDGAINLRSSSSSPCSRRDRVGPYTSGDWIAGKYQLIRPLCQGGMGSVWVGYNQALDVQVAIKLVRPDVRAAVMTERFLTEARIAARLEHPAIIGVHDLGNTDRGDPYLVMELLNGQDLRTLLDAEAALSAERAVQLLLPIAEGLGLAHAKGVVHRDLKPENIFVSDSEGRLQPKILDFGIAKPAVAPSGRRITRAGAVVGSPDYMSPEQARGQADVDHRADIWAFCAVLYECITGRAPFADSAYDDLLRDIVEKPITPIEQHGIEQPELWDILARGLEKDRDRRYANMRLLGRELALWLRARGIDEDVCGKSLKSGWLRDLSPVPSSPSMTSRPAPAGGHQAETVTSERASNGATAAPIFRSLDAGARSPTVSSDGTAWVTGGARHTRRSRVRAAVTAAAALAIAASALLTSAISDAVPSAMGATEGPLQRGLTSKARGVALPALAELRERRLLERLERHKAQARKAALAEKKVAAPPPPAPARAKAPAPRTWPFTDRASASASRSARAAAPQRAASYDPELGF